MDNMWCGLHTVFFIQPYTICNDYQGHSDELQHQPVDDQGAKGLSDQD